MTALAPSISYKTRSYSFARTGGNDLADGTLTLNVVRGNQPIGSSYALQCDRGQDGSIHTVLLLKEHSEDGECYEVELATDGSGRSRCTCWGYRRHESCKHNDAVADLISRGKLEEYVADEEPEECVREDDTPPAVLDRRKRDEAINSRYRAIRTTWAMIGANDPCEKHDPEFVPGSGWESGVRS